MSYTFFGRPGPQGGYPFVRPVQVFLQALAENQYLRVLAEPTLIALSGQEASFLAGGEGTLALKQKVTKIGKDATSDIVIKRWTLGKTAATISRTRDGYYFSYVSGFTKPKINDKKAFKKPLKLNELDIIQIGPLKLQFISKKPKKQKTP